MLPLFPQELATSCVAACVRMVLAGLGHSLSETEIRHRCGHFISGMLLNQVPKGLSDLPLFVEYEIEWGLDDLVDAVKAGNNPIVGIDLRPVEGVFAFHAIVILDIAAEQVLVNDPRYTKGSRSIALNSFVSAWNAADREAVIITADL